MMFVSSKSIILSRSIIKRHVHSSTRPRKIQFQVSCAWKNKLSHRQKGTSDKFPHKRGENTPRINQQGLTHNCEKIENVESLTLCTNTIIQPTKLKPFSQKEEEVIFLTSGVYQ